MRVRLHAFAWRGYTNLIEKLDSSFAGITPRHASAPRQDVADLITNSEDRIKRRSRVLKYHRDLPPAHVASRPVAHSCQVNALEANFARNDRTRFGNEPENRSTRHALPGP